MKKKIVFVCLAICFSLTSQAHAIIIYDTLGPLNSISGTGWVVGRGGSSSIYDSADAFIPTDNYSLDSVDLAVGLINGINEVDISLMSDNAGQPGSIIESWNIVGEMGEWGFDTPIISVDSTINPLLSVGNQYWLVASAPKADLNDPSTATLAAWNENTLSIFSTHAFRLNKNTWSISQDSQGAFRVHGSVPTPEPEVMFLFGSGIIGGLALRRRRPV